MNRRRGVSPHIVMPPEGNPDSVDVENRLTKAIEALRELETMILGVEEARLLRDALEGVVAARMAVAGIGPLTFGPDADRGRIFRKKPIELNEERSAWHPEAIRLCEECFDENPHRPKWAVFVDVGKELGRQPNAVKTVYYRNLHAKKS